MVQSEVDSLRRTTRTEDECLLVPLLVEHRFNTLGETDDVAVETLQLDISTLVNDLDDVDGTNGSGLWCDAVEIGNDLLLVGDSHVESLKFGIGTQHFVERLDGRNLVVLIHSIDALILESLVEVADGE